MAAYLTCQSVSGLPLFIRRKGDIPALPFPIVASLNGVYTYTKTQEAELEHVCTENTTVVWREYQEKFLLCLVATDTTITTVHLKHTLDIIFQTMVFYLGLDDLLSLKNIERMKKDLKLCYPLIDKILDSLNPQEDWDNFCDITNCSDILSCSERPTLKAILNSFTESVGTVFGCLRVHQKTVTATANWWTLDNAELLQIQLLCSNDQSDTGIDIPIYLPVRSPKTAFRLVCWKLTQHSDVCLLCGPTPSLSELEKETKRFWRTAFTALKSAESCWPANIPPEIALDPSLLSYLLINYEKRRSLSSLSPHSGDVHTHLTPVRKRDILRTFYKTVVGNMISLPGAASAESLDSTEVFMNFEYYVCHAWKKEPYLILILYPTGLHNHFMRSITRDALRVLTCDKNCKW